MKSIKHPYQTYLALFAVGLLSAACGGSSDSRQGDNRYFTADDDQGGLNLPPGLQAYVIAEDIGKARHVAINDQGDIYVKLREPHENGGGIAALRDTDGDGRADEIKYFGDFGGTGIAFYNGFLYATNDSTVFRYVFDKDSLLPRNATSPDTIVSGFPNQQSHAA